MCLMCDLYTVNTQKTHRKHTENNFEVMAYTGRNLSKDRLFPCLNYPIVI